MSAGIRGGATDAALQYNGVDVLVFDHTGVKSGFSLAALTVTQNGVGAVARSAQGKVIELVSAEDFGATADGVTNDAPAINAAITAVNAAGSGIVMLPGHNYALAAPIILKSGVYLLGNGSNATRLKLVMAANCNILETPDFATLTLSNKWLTTDGVPYGFGFDRLTFDGNRANQTVAGGVAIYGKGYNIGNDVKIVNPKGVGFYSECSYGGGQNVEQDMPEGHIGKLQIYMSGMEGFVYRGPHDQPIGDVSVSQAGQDGTYDGVVFEGKLNVYNGGTYVTGSIHSYACTGRGIAIKTSLHANMLTGESNVQDGVVFEATGETAGMIGGLTCTVGLLEAYKNDVNSTGTYWGVRVSGTQNTVSRARVSVSRTAAGGIYNAGTQNRITGQVNGTVVGASNGIGFRNGANYAVVNVGISNFDQTGDIGLQTDAAAYCDINATVFNCATTWKNNGASSHNTFHVKGYAASGTAFTQAGTFAATDNFTVNIVQGGNSFSDYGGGTSAILFGTTSTTLNHYAFKTPTAAEINLTQTMDWGANRMWVANITATSFDVVTDTAAPAGGLTFGWNLSV
jgi:hypothetical protein